jgi:hypothetical protein
MIKKTKHTKIQIISGLFLIISCVNLHAVSGNWTSPATGGNIIYTTTDPSTPIKDYAGNNLTIVYLENLGLTKIGGNSNATDVSWLLSKGYRVIELDYANNVNAVTPKINADIIAINDALLAGSFCGLTNCSKYRSYVLFEGYRIARDVSYFKDNPTIYNYPTSYTVGDSLYMDIIYPANASIAVPVVLSFSYSNSYAGDANKHQRMNLGNTLAGFNDSFLEGAPANGIAWAIADHPKYCDWGQGKPVGGANKAYGAYETNPDAAQKVKSAIRTLRTVGANLNLSGKIGVYGFSRGSTAGSMAIGDKNVINFENSGLHIGTSDEVQVAALGSGVFDYTLIFNTEESDVGNLRTNCPLGWGPLASNLELWQSQGSSYLVETSATAPVIFFYNTTDALYYQDQIAKLKAKLDLLSVPNSTITNYGTGHSVPQTTESLSGLYTFFKTYLTPPNVTTGIIEHKQNFGNMNLSLSPNPVTDKTLLRFNLDNPDEVKIKIYDITGKLIYKTDKDYNQAGEQEYTLNLLGLKLLPGFYFLVIDSNGAIGNLKFIKK